MTENKGDCISRKQVLDELLAHQYSQDFCKEHGIEYSIHSGMVRIIVNRAPTVEPERPQGEWIKVKEDRMSVDMSGEIVTRYKCSKCGRVIATFPSKLADYYPFCHCGADMRKGSTESLDYQRAVEDAEYCERYEPTYNPNDGSM